MSEQLPAKRQQEISDYLRNLLSDKDRTDFESRMESDPELNEDVLLEKSLLEALNENDWSLLNPNTNSSELDELRTRLRNKEHTAVSEKIRAIGLDYIEENKPEKSYNNRWLTAACAVFLIAIASFFVFRSSSLNDYYNDYQNWNDLPSLTEKSDTNNSLVKAEQLFQEKNYSESIELLTTIVESQEEKHPYALIYLGVSQFELQQYEAAHQTFDRLINTNSIAQSRGYWYKLLIYLKTEDKEGANRMIDKILSDPMHYNYKEAEELKGKF
ncbi:MAG: hypothetical protein HRT68_05390 [Flavobacteriaceae bacterium]|nr:hypothetical protein [Flavobacteriaceae bacterium]